MKASFQAASLLFGSRASLRFAVCFAFSCLVAFRFLSPHAAHASETDSFKTIDIHLSTGTGLIYRQEVIRDIPTGGGRGELGAKPGPSFSDLTPSVVAAGEQGELFVDDWLNHRVQKYGVNGEFRGTVLKYQPGYRAVQMAVRRDNAIALYVARYGSNEPAAKILVKNGRSTQKLPAKDIEGIVRLTDGGVWSINADRTLFRSLNLEKSISIGVEEGWPLAEGRVLSIKRVSAAEIEIGEHEARFRVRAQTALLNVKARTSVGNRIYLFLESDSGEFVLELDMQTDQYRLIEVPRVPIDSDLNSLGPSGVVFGVECSLSSSGARYECRLTRLVPANRQ